MEAGVRRWQVGHEWIYLVNAKKIRLDEGTILFRLLGNKKPRAEVVMKIFEESLEPYVTLLNNFSMEFRKMATSEHRQQIDPRVFEDLKELYNTREEVLRELEH